MKRKNYRVLLDISTGEPPNDDHAIHVGVKHAFNAAAAAGEKALAIWAVGNGLSGEWRKTGAGITKEGGIAVRGFRIWNHVGSGRRVRVDIELLAEEG